MALPLQMHTKQLRGVKHLSHALVNQHDQWVFALPLAMPVASWHPGGLLTTASTGLATSTLSAHTEHAGWCAPHTAVGLLSSLSTTGASAQPSRGTGCMLPHASHLLHMFPQGLHRLLRARTAIPPAAVPAGHSSTKQSWGLGQ